MKKFFVILFLSAFMFQPLLSFPKRYIDDVFSQYIVTENVVYGSNIDFMGNTIDLKMDVYTPDGDNQTVHPLIILMHGGYLYSGDKKGDYVETYCKRLAKKGYVCASINYRMGIASQTLEQFGNAMIRAVQDARAAVRFFRRYATNYGIDPDNIFWGGYAAGGMVAMHSSYCTDEDIIPYYDEALVGNMEGNSGNPGYPSNAKGVIAQAAGIFNYQWIQAGEVPNVLFHGTNDAVIPYGYGMAMGLFPFCGSQLVNNTCNSLGINSTLFSFDGMGHDVFPNDPENTLVLDSIINSTAKFVYSLLDPEYKVTRYLDDVFTSYNITEDVVYGNNVDFMGNPFDLKMDIYTPPEGDNETLRPLIILMHGGAFHSGDKKGDYVETYCKRLAKKGYVCASINYRMGFASLTLEQFGNAMGRAVQDARAAVRFFRRYATTYGIDPDNIFYGGYSAGSLIGLHASYCKYEDVIPLYDEDLVGDMEGNSGNPGYPSNVKGVISQSGGLVDYRWINSGEVPNLLFHGTNDEVVPIGYGLGLGLFPVCGSLMIHNMSDNVGVYSILYTFAGMGHYIFADDPEKTLVLDSIVNCIAKFVYSLDVQVSTRPVRGITPYTAESGAKIGEDRGSAISQRGICWNTTGNPTTTGDHTTDGTGCGSFSSCLTGLEPETNYFVRGFATSSIVTSYGPEINFWTLSEEPAGYSSYFFAEAVASIQINLNFQPAGEITDCDGYLLLRRTGSIAPNATGITDGSAPASLSLPAGTQLVAVITNPVQAIYNDRNLQRNTQYSYALIPFNWDGSNFQTYNYRTSPNIPVTSATTGQPTLVKPTSYPTNFRITSVSSTSVVLNWTDATGGILPTRYLVIAAPDGFDNIATPQDGHDIGNSNLVANVFPGKETITFRNLSSEHQYFFRIFPYRGSCDNKAYKTDGDVPGAETYLIPSRQAGNLAASLISQTGMRISFQSGNGQGRLLISKTTPISSTPLANGTTYSADTSFTGSGSTVDGSGKVIYVGNGNSVDVTGLSIGTTYYFRIFEYNGTGAESIFNQGYAANSSRMFSTRPKLILLDESLDLSSDRQMTITSIYPNPADEIINISIDVPGDRTADINIYRLSGKFMDKCSGIKLAKGSQVVKFDSHGLEPGIYIIEISSGNELIYSKVEIFR